MTTEETTKIFSLLSEYYPNAKQLKSKTTKAAWRLVLEKFPYADTKAQVVRYAASAKYFPDVSDITGGLTPEPGAFQPTGKPSSPPVNDRLLRNIDHLRQLARREP